jgi:hypothetical protein
MVKLEDYKTGKEYSIFGPEIGYVGPFTPRGSTLDGEIQGKWYMKLKGGEKFSTFGTISLYIELVKILIRKALDKEAVDNIPL